MCPAYPPYSRTTPNSVSFLLVRSTYLRRTYELKVIVPAKVIYGLQIEKLQYLAQSIAKDFSLRSK